MGVGHIWFLLCIHATEDNTHSQVQEMFSVFFFFSAKTNTSESVIWFDLVSLISYFLFLTAEFYPKFRDSGLIQTLIKLIKTQGTNPQTCYNAMAVLESFSLKGLLSSFSVRILFFWLALVAHLTEFSWRTEVNFLLAFSSLIKQHTFFSSHHSQWCLTLKARLLVEKIYFQPHDKEETFSSGGGGGGEAFYIFFCRAWAGNAARLQNGHSFVTFLLNL